MGTLISSGNSVRRGERNVCDQRLGHKRARWADPWCLAPHRHCFHATASPPAKPALGFKLLFVHPVTAKIGGESVKQNLYTILKVREEEIKVKRQAMLYLKDPFLPARH